MLFLICPLIMLIDNLYHGESYKSNLAKTCAVNMASEFMVTRYLTIPNAT